MRTSRAIVLAGLAFLAVTRPLAAQPVMQALPGLYAAPATYQGPGNAVGVNATFWGGLRPYNAASIGANAIQLCAAADTTCAFAENETVNASGLVLGTVGSACNNSTNICLVQTIYNLSGGAAPNAVQTTTGNRPTFKISCAASAYCIHFTRANSQRIVSVYTTATYPQPLTVHWVAERNGSLTSQSGIACLQTGSNLAPCDYFFTSNDFIMYAGGTVGNVAQTDNAWHVESSVYNNSTSPGAILDGVATAPSANPGSGSGTGGGSSVTLTFGGNQQGSNYCDCDWLEGGYWPIGFTTTQGQALNANIKAFYPSLP